MSENQTMFTTPGGKELILKNRITARERNVIRRAFTNGLNISTGKVESLSGAMIEDYESALITSIVVKYGDHLDNFGAHLLDSSPDEYDFVVAECTKISNAVFPQAK